MPSQIRLAAGLAAGTAALLLNWVGPLPAVASEPEAEEPTQVCVGDASLGQCFTENDGTGWTLAAQDRLAPVAADIYRHIAADRGYIDIGVNFSAEGIDVYYEGEISDPAQRIFEHYRSQGIPVQQVETAFGLEAFDKLAMQLWQAIEEAGHDVSRMRPNGSYTGIEIAGPAISRDAALQESVRAIAAPLIDDLPVTFIEHVQPQALSRHSDSPPYRGGARIETQSWGNPCTAGFAMSSSTHNYLLTAAHCSNFQNSRVFATGPGVVLGTSGWVTTLWGNTGLDAMLINLGSTGVHWQFYSGAWNSSAVENLNQSEPWAQSLRGCLSGATSGIRCDIQRNGVITDFVDINTAVGVKTVKVFPVIPVGWAQQHIGASGDSGGPFFRTTQTGERSGFGILSAGHYAAEGQTSQSCSGTYDQSNYGMPTCYSALWVTPINQILPVLSPYGIGLKML